MKSGYDHMPQMRKSTDTIISWRIGVNNQRQCTHWKLKGSTVKFYRFESDLYP